MTVGASDRYGRLPTFGTHRSSRGNVRLGLAGLVGDQNSVADRIAYAVKELPAAMDMTPTLVMRTFQIATHVQEVCPCRVVQRAWIARARDVCLSAVVEFVLRPSAAPRTGYQQHQCATAAAAASSIRRPVRN